MANIEVKNVKLSGISACVPLKSEENIDLKNFVNSDEAKKFIDSTGVERRRIADSQTTTLDLCFYAADKLISNLKWDKESIDCLIFVTQTPDYILPASSCILQDKLQLNEECYTLDISSGCSGWVYGMSVVTSLLSLGNIKRGLLLCGDTTLKPVSHEDKSAYPLFGDAGTATAFEFEKACPDIKFHLATDGSGYDAIIIPDGGFRNPFSEKSLQYEKVDDGIIRNRLHTILNGMDVFSFGISKAPQSVNKLLEFCGLERELIDYFTFHQANLFMNEKIRKKLQIPPEKVPYSLKDFGNTSSATIPLTMVTQLQKDLQSRHLKNIACGFGVGLSWASVYFETNHIVVPDLIEI